MGNPKSKYSGCGITTVIFVGVSFAIAYVRDYTTDYPLLFIIRIIVGGIIFDIFITTIVEAKRKNEKNETCDKLYKDKDIDEKESTKDTSFQEIALDVQGLELQKHISEDFFDNVNNITNELINIFRKLENDDEFNKAIKEKQYSWKINSSILDMSYHIHADTIATSGLPKGTKSTITEKIRTLFLSDLVRCYLKLNCSTDFDTMGLVAEYVGQTAVKTNKIIDAALDGVLFIDEAYSLISNSVLLEICLKKQSKDKQIVCQRKSI